jgi:hypothetical protein
MTHSNLAVVSETDVYLFVLLLTLLFFGLFAVFLFSIWASRRQSCPSPYSGMPMRRASELSYEMVGKVLRYLYNYHQYDNRIFELAKAAVCRETGRIFPDAITWYDTIRVDWSFLKKRHPGNYVSWGSLTREQQEEIRSLHGSLEGFQTEYSSPTPNPKNVEPEYAFTTPGPLYVDFDAKILLGWKRVPESDLEVLIVQRPMNIITLTLT